jgi:CheY-like chemotaxis protein/two-component sensor histidine kinase
MNAILGFSDLISNESHDPDIVFFARKIHTSGKRLMATLKAILDLADLEATKSKIKINDLNTQDVIAGIIQPFYPAANDKGLYLITEFKDGIYARADENLLHIILQNLIDNAIKFTHNGGVKLETDLVTANGNTWSLISVKDTGIGIPSEKFEFIFHEFRQLSEGYNRSFEGTGLGLTLARKMVELLNGKISVESEVGLGSIFTVWLPASSRIEKTTSGVKSKTQEEIPSRIFKIHPPEELPWILVVEDNDDNAEIVKLYLRGRYKTERAADASSALKMVKEKQFSGILMDINLGAGIDGLKATQDIRKLAQYKHVPIIAITGYTMSGDREKLLKGGCSHYLGKPFSQQGLLELMTEIFE